MFQSNGPRRPRSPGLPLIVLGIALDQGAGRPDGLKAAADR